MLLVGLAFAWALGCVAAAWRYPRSVAQLRVASWATELAEALRGAHHDPERVVIVNDALAEAEHALVRRQGLPTATAWLSLAGCALVLVAGLVLQPEAALLLVLAAAGGGVGGCMLAKRVGAARARTCRARLDAEVRQRLGQLYDAEVEVPRRRAMRWRRRRG